MTQKELICKKCGSPFLVNLLRRAKKRCPPCENKYVSHKRKIRERKQFKTGFVGEIPIVQYYFARHRTGAHKRGLEFSINVWDYEAHLWGKPCYYCGAEIRGCGIDRKDSSIGYVIENCVPCCYRCNISKRTMSENEFISMCKTVALLHTKLG